MVLIDGAAGLGKTTLLMGALDHARAAGIRVFVGGSTADRYRPFGVLLGALGISGAEGDDARSGLWSLLDTVDLPLVWEREGAQVRHAAHDQLGEIVQAEVATGPVILALDDFHLADAASVHAILVLSALCERSRLLIVLASRRLPVRSDVHDTIKHLARHAIRCTLRPLDDVDSARLVNALVEKTGIDPRPRPDFAATMNRLGGNPFLLVAATQAASRGLPPGNAEMHWSALSCLDGLGSSDVELLRIAAVFGRSFEPADLALVHHSPEVEIIAALERAVIGGVLVAVGRKLRFVHDLVAESIVSETPEPIRVGFQRAIWTSFARAGRHPSTYVEHVMAVGDSGDRSAVDALVAAANEVLELDPTQATDWLKRAFELTSMLPWVVRGDVAIRYVHSLRLANRLGEVVDLVEQCLTWPIEPGQLANLELIGAGALRFLGRVPESSDMLRRALRRNGLSPSAASWTWSLIVGAEVFSLAGSSKLEDALVEARRLAQQAGDRSAIVQAECAASSVAWAAGRVSEALAHAEAAAELSVALKNTVWPAPPLFESLALLAAGDVAGAIATITPWGRRAEVVGDLWALSRMEMVTVFAYLDSGNWDAIEAHCATILRVGDETGGANGQPLAQAVLGLIECRRGSIERARDHLAAGKVVAASPCLDPIGLPFLGWLESEIAESSGDIATAKVVLDATFDIIHQVAPVACIWLAPSTIRLAVSTGDDDRVSHVAVALCSISDGSPYLAFVADLATKTSQSDGAGVEQLARSDRGGQSPYMGREAARIAAVLHRRLGNECAAKSCDDHVAALGQLLGVVVTRPSSRRRPLPRRPRFGAQALTATERAVLGLVAEGRANGNIAQVLNLSKRTVESHTSALYTKLGVTTRVELARVLLANGQLETSP